MNISRYLEFSAKIASKEVIVRTYFFDIFESVDISRV